MFNTVSRASASRTKRWQAPALLAAAGLAASFVYVRAQSKKAERENPPAGQFVVVDGVRLHNVERGEGPALVLLHGNGVFLQDFELSGLLEHAARRYRVIAFDRPGFGYSERPRGAVWMPATQAKLLHDALRALGVERPIVLGHSWGTLVALSMALDFPADVRALALLSGYYYPSVRLDAPLSAVPALPVIGHLLRYTVSPLLGRLIWPAVAKRMFSPREVAARFNFLPVWMALRPRQLGASAAESGMMIPAAALLQKRYAELAMPVAIVTGTGDLVVDAQHNAVRLHEQVRHSNLLMEPGVGHMVHYAAPDRVMAAVDALEQAASRLLAARPDMLNRAPA